jgi:hypothetical protein
METRNSLLRGDYWVQTILGILIICCCISVVGFFAGLLLAAPFGAWQVISALILGISYGDKKRLTYLACVIIYFVSLYILLTSEANNDYEILYGILAVILGIYYYSLTYSNYKNLVQIPLSDPINQNILDA